MANCPRKGEVMNGSVVKKSNRHGRVRAQLDLESEE
jgi:hypothetical protein